MNSPEPFNPLERFAEIERLVSKIYFRFSHLFMADPAVRDFWWEMAREEEQHACILHACNAIVANFDEDYLDPSISPEKALALKERLSSYLQKGTPALTIDEAFTIALDIEASEIDAIYSKLLQLGGPQIAKTMENLGVPASAQRQKLRAATRRFCASNPALLNAIDRI
jgi:hypothetical protein